MAKGLRLVLIALIATTLSCELIETPDETISQSEWGNNPYIGVIETSKLYGFECGTNMLGTSFMNVDFEVPSTVTMTIERQSDADLGNANLRTYSDEDRTILVGSAILINGSWSGEMSPDYFYTLSLFQGDMYGDDIVYWMFQD